MKRTVRWFTLVVFVAGVFILATPMRADDWPAYRMDGARSGITAARLDFPLGTAWVRRMPQAPQPAWPDCGRAFSIFEFDYAYMPVAVDGIVYQASSSDDTVYALNAADGTVRWTYTAGAPVRFAPHIAHGRAYFSSDDGWVYCLDARTGEVAWTVQVASDNRMFIGNDRMISRWPSRSGVLVEGETAYVVGGMWPSEGVNVYALDARTGAVQWRNDTINAIYLPYPHDGLSMGGPTSQGYLLSNGHRLVMPTGESSPAILDAETGDLVHWDARPAGSTWATLVDNFVATPARGWQPNIPTRLGETELFRADGLAYFSLDGGRADYGKWNSFDRLPGSPRLGVDRWRGQIFPIGGRNRIVHTGDRFYTSGMGELDASDSSGNELKRLWKIEHDRIYEMVLAGDVLIVGSDGYVSAVNASSGEVIWRGEVDGQARGLAVAGGTLYVSTEKGTLFAFAPGRELVAAEPRTIAAPPAPAGYALVIGSTDTAAAERLASAQKLNVIVLLPDERSVQEARTRLLRQGGYGRHIVVHKAPEDGLLPYGDFFASEVLVVGSAQGIRPSEIYRVLRPITGRMWFANMNEQQVTEFSRRAGIPGAEVQGRVVNRGKLEGSFDWDSENAVDLRVSWPLELLWFGGPGRQRILSRHNTGLPPPIAASGRIYSLGDGYVIAIDAYNGKELWSYYAPGYRHVAADDNYAYISMGGHVMQVDAQTGRLDKVYGNVEPRVLSLDQPQEFSSESNDKEYGGTITVRRTDTAVEIRLTSTTPEQDDKDGWVMWFDFRAPEDRLLPAGQGRFPLIVDLKRGRLRRFDEFAGGTIPAVDLHATDDGYVVRIPYSEIRQLTGRDPDTFDLAAEIELWKHADQRRMFQSAPITQRRDPWRQGMATFVLRGEARPALAPMAEVDRADSGDLPVYARNWGRMPQFERHDGNVPRLPIIPEGREELAVRTNPITGDQGDLFFLRGYGCGGTVASGTMNVVRSGTVGLYDLEDDSGMRNMPGTRAGCRITLSPSLGLLLSLEGTGDCFCPYNFPTNLAMAPAHVRSNEDWAVFTDQARVGQMRQLGLNFGAPGDRRDEQGLLWLGYPKTQMMFATGGSLGPFPQTISLPLALDVAPGGGPYRVNADRVVVQNTNRPWITASGVEGIRKLSLGLIYHEQVTTALAVPVAAAPRIDGRLDDAAWAGDPGVALASNPGSIENDGRVQVRFDRENLYLSFARQAAVDRRGIPQPWDGDTQFNVFLKDTERSAYAQFKVALDGGMTSQAVSNVVNLPRLADVVVDGTPAEWRDRGVEIELGDEHGAMRMALTDKGLAVLMQVPVESAEGFDHGLRVQFANLEKERILELVVDKQKGTAEVIRGLVVDRDGTEAEPTVFDALGTTRPRRNLNHLRESEKIEAEVVVRNSGGQVLVEALIPLDALELGGMASPSIGFQLSAFDPEHRDANARMGSGARRDLLASGSLISLVAGDANTPSRRVTTSNIRNDFYGKIWNFNATQREIPVDQWKSAVHRDDETFSVEVAIPLRVLGVVDLSLERLLAQFGAQGDMSANLDELYNRFSSRFVRVHGEQTPVEPLPYILRLHFAELDEVAPGQRVFDIKIQGRTAVEGLDIAREAGGSRRALSKDFHLTADRDLTVEFVPRVGEPRISGLELLSAP